MLTRLAVVAASFSVIPIAGSAQTLCRDSIAVSEGIRLGQYTVVQAKALIAELCHSGDPIRLNAPHSAIFCDFSRQVVQEGRGVVVCIMARLQ
jgi:hypothetical protein